jgi:hypothetical protein
MRHIVRLAAALICFSTAGAAAQDTSPVPLVTCALEVPSQGDAIVSADTLLKLARTQCRNRGVDNWDGNPRAGLDDRLFLSVSMPSGHDANELANKIKDWRLSINGIAIDDSQLSWEAAEDSTVVVSVKLRRSTASKTAWNELLTQKVLDHPVAITITDDNKRPFPSNAFFNLQVIRLSWYRWVMLGILAVLVIVLCTNDRLKQMLREDGPRKNKDKPAAYSLARVQMFYWFALTIGCYVVIWIITGDRDTINNDVLTVMGISAATFLGAVVIDSSKKAQAQSQLPDAAAKLEQAQNAATAAAAHGGPNATTARTALLVQQRAFDRLDAGTLADYNVQFLTDILSDADGLSFHRFQIFAWNLVLGVIFLASVVQTLSMPTFGNTLLGLMGISGGTYLGFKFPEQKTPPT